VWMRAHRPSLSYPSGLNIFSAQYTFFLHNIKYRSSGFLHFSYHFCYPSPAVYDECHTILCEAACTKVTADSYLVDATTILNISDLSNTGTERRVSFYSVASIQDDSFVPNHPEWCTPSCQRPWLFERLGGGAVSRVCGTLVVAEVPTSASIRRRDRPFDRGGGGQAKVSPMCRHGDRHRVRRHRSIPVAAHVNGRQCRWVHKHDFIILVVNNITRFIAAVNNNTPVKILMSDPSPIFS